MNIKNVLVPVDFSPPSRLALGYGIALARRLRAKLTLMYVMEPMGTLALPLANTPAGDSEEREQLLQMLSALVASEDQDDLDLRIVIRSGGVKDQILSVINEEHTDLLIMGTHGRGLVGRLVIGSITEGLLRKVSIPVLTVSHATRPLTFNRILFATDLSEGSKATFVHALDLARMMSSHLIVVYALNKIGVAYSELVPYGSEYDVDEAKSRLAEFAAEAKRWNVAIETIIAEGTPSEVILESADDNDIDLILISIEKKGIVERALLGTTAEGVIREANVPVLTIPESVSLAADELAHLLIAKTETSNVSEDFGSSRPE